MVETLAPDGTLGPPRGAKRSPTVCAYLVVAFDGARPLDAPSRHWLVDVDVVSIGRHPRRAWARSDEGGMRLLRLRVPDARVSAKHATLHRSRGSWTIQDGDGSGAPSRNGTALNGAAVSAKDPTELSDGDRIAVGGTILVFRSAPLEELPTTTDETADGEVFRGLPEGLRTFSAALERQFADLVKIARSAASVVVLGAPGTGKELVARAVHSLSGRRGKLVPVNCGGIPDTLIESELFGHAKGAFSGAVADKLGVIAISSGGTLFLDEIGELPPEAQAALLRVLQDGEVRAVGATSTTKVDLRVIAATNRDLPHLVGQERFRADLWSRINAFTIALPALADRKEDLGILLRALLPRYAKDRTPAFTESATRAIFEYHWPLNTRALEKAIERAVALAVDEEIDVVHLPPEVTGADDPRERLIALLRKHQGDTTAAAAERGVSRQAIEKQCKVHGVDYKQFRARIVIAQPSRYPATVRLPPGERSRGRLPAPGWHLRCSPCGHAALDPRAHDSAAGAHRRTPPAPSDRSVPRDCVTARNPGTVVTGARPRRAPSFRALFEAAFSEISDLYDAFTSDGALIVALGDEGEMNGYVHLRAVEHPTFAVIGRHTRCDLVLRDPDVSLRHVAVSARRVGLSELRLRLWDLDTGGGLVTETNKQCEGLESDGCMFFRVGGRAVLCFPTGSLAPIPWGTSAAETWEAFPERVVSSTRRATSRIRVDENVRAEAPRPTTRILAGPGRIRIRSGPAGCSELVAGRVRISTQADWMEMCVTPEQLVCGVLVGSYERCGLITALDGVSRVHLLLATDAGAVWAVDVGSTNGTTCGGISIRQTCLDDSAELVLAGRVVVAWTRSGEM